MALIEYTVLWDGSKKDQYLCVPDPMAEMQPSKWSRPVVIPPTRSYADRSKLKFAMLELLRERPRWIVNELREALNADLLVLYGIIDRAVRHGQVARVSPGVIRRVRVRGKNRVKSAAKPETV